MYLNPINIPLIPAKRKEINSEVNGSNPNIISIIAMSIATPLKSRPTLPISSKIPNNRFLFLVMNKKTIFSTIFLISFFVGILVFI